MILQEHWYVKGYVKKDDEGFWLTGRDYNDCIHQLKEYGKAHPEKWIFFSDCGMRPGKPVPVPEQLFEVGLLPRRVRREVQKDYARTDD